MRAARAGAACASMSTSRVWMSAMRIGSLARLGLGHQRGALDVGVEHEVDQRLRAARRLLLDATEARALGIEIVPAPARSRPRSSGTASSCRRRCGRRARRGRRRQRRGRLVEQEARAEPLGEVVDVKHGGLLTRPAAAGKGRAVRKGRSSRRVMVAIATIQDTTTASAFGGAVASAGRPTAGFPSAFAR